MPMEEKNKRMADLKHPLLKLNTTRDSGFSETTVEDLNNVNTTLTLENSWSKIEPIITDLTYTKAEESYGLENKVNELNALQNNIQENENNIEYITVINTTVRTEMKQIEETKFINDDGNIEKPVVLDVNIKKSCEELIVDGSKVPEYSKNGIECRENENKQKVSDTQNSKSPENIVFEVKPKDVIATAKSNGEPHVVKKAEKRKQQQNDDKKSSAKGFKSFKNHIFSLFPSSKSHHQKEKDTKTVNFIESYNEPHKINDIAEKTNEYLPSTHQISNNKFPDLIDSEQKLRLMNMKNKSVELIMNNLDYESSQPLTKCLVVRSIDLLRFNKIESFDKLNERLKSENGEYMNKVERGFIDTFMHRLEDLLKVQRVLSNLELQNEPEEEKIIFPCDNGYKPGKRPSTSIHAGKEDVCSASQPKKPKQNDENLNESNNINLTISEPGKCEEEPMEVSPIVIEIDEKLNTVNEISTENEITMKETSNITTSINDDKNSSGIQAIIQTVPLSPVIKQDPEIKLVKKNIDTKSNETSNNNENKKTFTNKENYLNKYAWALGLDSNSPPIVSNYVKTENSTTNLDTTLLCKINKSIEENNNVQVTSKPLVNNYHAKVTNENTVQELVLIDIPSILMADVLPTNNKTTKNFNSKGSKEVTQPVNQNFIDAPSSMLLDLHIQNEDDKTKINKTGLFNKQVTNSRTENNETLNKIIKNENKKILLPNLSWREANEKARLYFYSGIPAIIRYNEKNNLYSVYVEHKY